MSRRTADLALPDYLSKIVNNGIQQGGVENAVPNAIRQSEMNRLFIFASADDKTLIIDSYILVDQKSPDYEQYVKEYPALAKEPIYVRKDLDQAAIDKLNPVMAQILPGSVHPRAGDGRSRQGRGDGARLSV